MTKYDSVIIGGGPAGSAAAISLARAGLRVLLLEAKPICHDKLCGEFLSPECQALLAQLDVHDTLRRLGPAVFSQASIIGDNGARWIAPLPGAAWGLSRARMDEAMLIVAASCGTVVHDRQGCTNVSGDLRSGFSVCARDIRTDAPETYSARTVISAHGKRSTMDRTLGRRFIGQRYPLLGMKRHFRGPPVASGVALHTFAGGYCGLANIEDGLVNLCFLAQAEALKKAINTAQPAKSDQARSAALLGWLASSNPVLGDWLRQAEPVDAGWQSVGALAFGVRGTVARDILNVGDAAGLIAPLAGDGIAMALQSAMICAAHVERFLRGACSADELKQGYAREWHNAFAGRIRLAGALQALALRPALLHLLLRMIPHVPALGRYLIKKTRSQSVDR